MNVYRNLADIPVSGAPVALAIGQFDGVHLGHRRVLEAAIQTGHEPWVLTFSPHVADILNPAKAPLRLTTLEQQLDLFREAGIHSVLVLPFDREVAHWTAEEFMQHLHRHIPMLSEIVVGRNFTCGRDRTCNDSTIGGLAQQIGATARIVPHLEWEGAPVSSTRIRHAVQTGHLKAVLAMLGRPFSLTGAVIQGRRFGRTIGFPTANVQPRLSIRPKPGVYAAALKWNANTCLGGAFVPDTTADSQKIFGTAVEIHLLNWAGDIYGQEVDLFFLDYIRAHKILPTAQDLKAQLTADMAEIKSRHPPGTLFL